jgi:hypothetical protein
MKAKASCLLCQTYELTLSRTLFHGRKDALFVWLAGGDQVIKDSRALEFVDRVTAFPLSIRASETVQDCGLGVFEVGQA